MLKFGVTCIALAVVANCATIKDEYAMKQREKRSPHPPCESDRPFGPPPRFGPLPPPPPRPHHHHHGYHASAFSEANAQVNQGPGFQNQQGFRNQRGFQNQQGFENQPGFQNQQGFNQQQRFQNQHQSQGLQNQGGFESQGGLQQGQPDCDTCKDGKNSAVSNAQTVTGNAVAVAVSKG